MAKETNPKNTALEADVLKAAEGAVDQKAVKDKATEIAGKAPEGETVPGKTETVQGEPAAGTQFPGSNLPPVANQAQAPAGSVPADYAEYLKWKANQEMANQAPALQQAPAVSEYEAREREAQEAARKAYKAVMEGQKEAANASLDQSKNTDAASLHAIRLGLYGPGYVVAKRQGIEQVFTAQTWKLLGGRNNKDGYTEVVAAPPEVQALKQH